MLNKLFLTLFLPSLLFAQMSSPPPPVEDTTPPATNLQSKSSSMYDIEYFSFKDLSTDTYWVSIVSDKPDELLDELEGKKEKKLRVQIGETKTDIKAGTAKKDSNNPSVVNFLVSAYYKIEAGKTQIKLFSKYPNATEVLESTLDFVIPHINNQPGKQPYVLNISPEGGARGDAITIHGKNFGEEIDDISIVLYESAVDSNGDDTYTELDERKPFYLSPVINEEQDLRFNISLSKDLMKGGGLRKSLKVKVFVSGRPSNYVSLTLLPPQWKIYSGLLGFVVTILFLICLYVILRGLIKKHQEKDMKLRGGEMRPSIVYFFEMMLTDKATNTYSLSKFQAFVWTIASIGSYAYVIISQGLLLRNGKIPDFNPNLIVLMSISYGGLLAANGLGAKRPKNEVKSKPPELSNLFCEGGSVDLSRLQLFGFTLVSIGAYMYNLALGNPLHGLPDIPPTLLGLMGISQTGYLGSKAIGKEIAINALVPNKIEVGQENVTISILGSGFVTGTKILLEGYSYPIPAECSTATELSFVVPRFDTVGKHGFTILPTAGTPVQSIEEIEIVEIGQAGFSVSKAPSEEDLGLQAEAKQELEVYKEDEKTQG